MFGVRVIARILLAAPAIGVAMDFDRNQVGGLSQGGEEQGAQGEQTQVGSHDRALASRWQSKRMHFARFLSPGINAMFPVVARHTGRMIADHG